MRALWLTAVAMGRKSRREAKTGFNKSCHLFADACLASRMGQESSTDSHRSMSLPRYGVEFGVSSTDEGMDLDIVPRFQYDPSGYWRILQKTMRFCRLRQRHDFADADR